MKANGITSRGHEHARNGHAEELPIIVIGGGPAGSTVSTLLRRHGHSVLLLEKARFPRFHIGESLLVYTQDYWERLNLNALLGQEGFTVKYGGELRIGKAPERADFHRSTMSFSKVPRSVKPKRNFAYQVERSRFDQLLLDQARRAGVDVRCEAKVLETSLEQEPMVRWQDARGNEHRTRARFVVDASGRHALLARRLGHFRKETNYLTSSVFGHFEGVSRDPGKDGGSINVYLIQDGWVWFIPLADGKKMSIGIVMNERQTRNWPKNPDEIFRQIFCRYDYLRERLREARQIGAVRILRNLPYYADQIAGPGWALCGDAALFVDPIHSSGVHLAFCSATLLADELHAHLSGDTGAMARYVRKVKSHHENVRRNVSLYYACIRYRSMMLAFVFMTGRVFRNWSGPWLSRVSAWSFGQYDRHLGAMNVFWGLARLGLLVMGAWYGVTKRDPWGRHGMQAALRPFELPRIAEPELEVPVSPPVPEKEGDVMFHIEPGAQAFEHSQGEKVRANV